MKINIHNIINKSIAISTEDAKKVKKKMIEALDQYEEIEVSFENISMLISHFLNVSIGELYIDYKEKWEVLDDINYTHISNDDLELLKDKIIPSFKNQPNDKEKFARIQKDILK